MFEKTSATHNPTVYYAVLGKLSANSGTRSTFVSAHRLFTKLGTVTNDPETSLASWVVAPGTSHVVGLALHVILHFVRWLMYS